MLIKPSMAVEMQKNRVCYCDWQLASATWQKMCNHSL